MLTRFVFDPDEPRTILRYVLMVLHVLEVRYWQIRWSNSCIRATSWPNQVLMLPNKSKACSYTWPPPNLYPFLVYWMYRDMRNMSWEACPMSLKGLWKSHCLVLIPVKVEVAEADSWQTRTVKPRCYCDYNDHIMYVEGIVARMP